MGRLLTGGLMIYLNEVLIKPTIFPDKTSQVWHLPQNLLKGGLATIRWEFESESELFHLIQLMDLIDHAYYYLVMDYLPYARQDKTVGNNNSFALRSFAKIINSLGFDLVSCIDVHSTTAHLINNLQNITPIRKIVNLIKTVSADAIVYPDAGASKKYRDEIDFCFIEGEKIRDQQTGRITSYKLNSEIVPNKILIVDDICDGGATFILLANELKKYGAKEISLYVTHGVFSKGIEVLKTAGIQRIFTYEGEVK